MNSKYTILVLALCLGGVIGAYIHKGFYSPSQPHPLNLEEILSIKELHLVKHSYKDLFFLHRKNDPNKSIRAIAQVPVTITSYINLKNIKMIRVNDTVKTIILPNAHLNEPNYEIDKLSIRKTRSFQLHAGADLYPKVTQYLKETLTQRMDSIRKVAMLNKILEQAEAEGKKYIETVLRAVGRPDIKVTFGNEEKDKEITMIQSKQRRTINRVSEVQTASSFDLINQEYIEWIPVD